ncbi:MAG: TauD/TfdA family dioxygenase [Nostoc sp. ChiQUE01a]|nr:TauD/TfdA family dioxygenase [Nostoc sp. ChiQUE01a]
MDASQAIASEVILQLKETLRDRHILIFKNQQLSDEQFFNFSLYFGGLFVPSHETPVLASKPGETPVVILISNVDGGYTGTGELSFHSDHKWTHTPSSGSLLYALEIPSQGGDTYCTNSL